MPSTIRDLNELLVPATNDYVLVSDTSDTSDRDKKMQLMRLPMKSGTPTAGNMAAWVDANYVQDIGFAATDVARLSQKQTYTRGLTITPPSGDIAILIDTLANPTERPIRIRHNGIERFSYIMNNSNNQFTLQAFDNGSNGGAVIFVGYNNNASTPTPGSIVVTGGNGTNYSIYPDNSNVWRTVTGGVNNGNFASGTVIGSQTSHAAAKDLLGPPVSDGEALRLITEAAAAVRRFVYKNGAYNGEEFSGIVLEGDALGRYGMDADPEHKAGKSLNLINAIGDLCLAVRDLSTRLAILEGR